MGSNQSWQCQDFESFWSVRRSLIRPKGTRFERFHPELLYMKYTHYKMISSRNTIWFLRFEIWSMIFSNSAVWVKIPRDVDSFPHWEHDLQKWTTGEISLRYLTNIFEISYKYILERILKNKPLCEITLMKCIASKSKPSHELTENMSEWNLLNMSECQWN